jgi:hypothetical protein
LTQIKVAKNGRRQRISGPFGGNFADEVRNAPDKRERTPISGH